MAFGGVALLLGALGCGERAVGGSGRLLPPDGPDAVAHLVVEGTPYEMGWWHGRLLAPEVGREAREPLEPDLASTLGAYAAGMRQFLPPDLEQELRGIADGAGVRADDLFLREAAEQGRRWHDPAPVPSRVEVHVAAGARDAPEILVRAVGRTPGLAGPFPARPLVVERRPAGRPATIVLSRPGALGAVAGASERGLVAFQAPAVGVDADRRSLRGPPFPVAFRRALETAPDADAFAKALPGLLGDLVAVADADGGRRGGTVLFGGDPLGPPAGAPFVGPPSWTPDLRADREGLRTTRLYGWTRGAGAAGK